MWNIEPNFINFIATTPTVARCSHASLGKGDWLSIYKSFGKRKTADWHQWCSVLIIVSSVLMTKPLTLIWLETTRQLKDWSNQSPAFRGGHKIYNNSTLFPGLFPNEVAHNVYSTLSPVFFLICCLTPASESIDANCTQNENILRKAENDKKSGCRFSIYVNICKWWIWIYVTRTKRLSTRFVRAV